MAENNADKITQEEYELRRAIAQRSYQDLANSDGLLISNSSLNVEKSTAGINIGQFGNIGNVKFDGKTEFGLSPSKLESVIKSRIASCREAYENSGIIGNAIDLMIDFALEGFDIVHPDKSIQGFYRAWARKINLPVVAASILKCYFRDGNVPILSFRARITKPQIEKLKKSISADDNEYLDQFIMNQVEKKTIPYQYSILDILNLYRSGSDLLDNVSYEYQILDSEISTIKKSGEGSDIVSALRDKIGESDFKKLVDTGRLRLPPSRLSMIFYKKDDYKSFANPMLWRIIDDLKFKQLLRNMDKSVCENAINAILLIKLGKTVEGFPPHVDAIRKMASLLRSPEKSKTIIWNDLVEIEDAYPPVKDILGKEKYEQVDADIRSGLGIAEVILNGQGGNYSNSYLSVKTLMERLESGRNDLLAWLESEMIKIAQALGFKRSATIKMRYMSLQDEEAEKKMMLELVDRGMVSYETCVDFFGEDFMLEIQRMKSEDTFRRKNELKYPYTLVKVGKFGPQITSGPAPIFKLLEEDPLSLHPAGNQNVPTAQGDKGKLGGRPAGKGNKQKKSTTPRNAPVGSNKSKSSETPFYAIYNTCFSSLSKKFSYDHSHSVSEKIAILLEDKLTGEITNKSVNLALKSLAPIELQQEDLVIKYDPFKSILSSNKDVSIIDSSIKKLDTNGIVIDNIMLKEILHNGLIVDYCDKRLQFKFRK